MHVYAEPSGALAARTVPISFELYPPRNSDADQALHQTIQQLAAVSPEFISVTYGAGGSTGGRSLEVLRYIRENTNVSPLAHLTCVGNSYAQASALIREFLDAGIDKFLALRGDPPQGSADGEVFLGDLESAAQLVQLIERVQAEREVSYEHCVTSAEESAKLIRPQGVEIAVAAFPNGHPRSRFPAEHLDALLAKEAAGATLAVTQLFFHADDYFRFVAQARQAGVTIPILPGVMPVTSAARLRRVLELTGEEVPAELTIALEIEPSAEGARAVGISYAANLVRDLVAGGACGIHLYAFNNHDTVLAVLREAGVLDN